MNPRDTWFLTYSGRRFYPMAPRAADIRIRDIAHALSLVCRFGGHCRFHYSVAQHSLLVADALPGYLRLAGLLHDATEAYLGDVIRPIKLQLPYYREAEKNLELLIERKFGIRNLLTEHHRILVKEADNRALITERNALLNTTYGYKWREDTFGIKPFAGVDIIPWQPAVAEERFMAAFFECVGGGMEPTSIGCR